ncbi:MAG: hypothetical protein AAF318_01670 [Pseudomonadota bacterium]
MAKADFITAIIFLCLGGYMIAEGLSLPGAGGFIEKGGEPGRVPIFLGSAIIASAIVLLLRAIARGGARLTLTLPQNPDVRAGLIRAIATALGCTFYGIGLLGAPLFGLDLPYALATGLFIFAFIVIAEWPEAGSQRLAGLLPATVAPKAWLMLTAGLQAVLTAVAVAYLFEQQFLVRLP